MIVGSFDVEHSRNVKSEKETGAGTEEQQQ